jgi:hypothetical protein
MTEQELKQLLTPEFLETLKVAVECCGWDCDMVETTNFCDWCHNLAGMPYPQYSELYDTEDDWNEL